MCKLKMFWTGGKKFVDVKNWEEGKKVAEEKARELKMEVEVTFQNGCVGSYGCVSESGVWE